jgi:hypothetical protein
LRLQPEMVPSLVLLAYPSLLVRPHQRSRTPSRFLAPKLLKRLKGYIRVQSMQIKNQKPCFLLTRFIIDIYKYNFNITVFYCLL